VKINDALCIFPSLSLSEYPEQRSGEDSTAPAITKEYELVSIMMHSGSAHSGHYFCYIKSRVQSDDAARWLLFNDSSVTAVSDEQLSVVLGTAPAAESPATPSSAAAEGSGGAKAAPTIPSANNAYMLVYREVSPVNLRDEGPSECGALAGDERIPRELREAVQRDNALYREQKAKYEYEKAFLHISVSPALLGGEFAKKCAAEVASSVASAEKEGDEKGDVVLAEDDSVLRKKKGSAAANRIIRIHESCTLRQLTDQVYENFVSPPALTPPASASFKSGVSASTGTGTNSALPRLLPSDGVPRCCVRLRAFDSLRGTVLPPSALLPKDIADRLEKDAAAAASSVDALPFDQELLEESTVLSALSDASLKRIMHLEVRAPGSLPFGGGSQQDGGVVFSLETVRYRPRSPREREADEASVFEPATPIQLPSDCTISDMIQRVFASASSAPCEDNSSTQIANMVIAIHDISSGIARQIFPRPITSRIDYDVALSTSLVSSGDRVYVDFSPSAGAARVGLMEYFENLQNAITVYFPDIRGCDEGGSVVVDGEHRMALSVDRRCALSEVKAKMAALLNRSVDSFVLLRMENSQTDTTVEIKNLTMSLSQNGFDDGSFILIRPGVPLAPGEYRVFFLFKSVSSTTAIGDAQDLFVRMGSACVLRGDQTVGEVKEWIRANRPEFLTPHGDNTNIRLQLAQRFTEDADAATAEDGKQPQGEYFKTTFVLDDEKSLRDCLGSQLKDGMHLSVTVGVAESSFSGSSDLFLSLWEWMPDIKQIVFHGDVVFPKTNTFADLKTRIQNMCAPTCSDDKYRLHLDAGDIFFAKPFTWQLKDAAANIPFLKWSSQPAHDGLSITGAPYRLNNAPLAGPALLLFKCCDLTQLVEDGDEAAGKGGGQMAAVPEEVGFRLYSAKEQLVRRAEEEKVDRERKTLIEEKLKALSLSGIHDTSAAR
jgi:hypothetical protein